jgi:hypothetical protein
LIIEGSPSPSTPNISTTNIQAKEIKMATAKEKAIKKL